MASSWQARTLIKYYPNPNSQWKVLLLLTDIHGLIFHRSVYYNGDLDRNGTLSLRAKIARATTLILWLSILTCGRWIAYYDDPNAITTLFRHLARLV